MARIVTTIDLSGPFFTHDPAKTFQGNVHTLMEAIAREGEQDVKAQMAAGSGHRRPLAGGNGARVMDYVRGRVESLGGKGWHYNAVVSPDRSGLSASRAIGLYAAASRIESQDHPFRRTAGRMRRAKALNTVELLRGLT